MKEEEDSASQKKRSLARPAEVAWVICKSVISTQDML